MLNRRSLFNRVAAFGETAGPIAKILQKGVTLRVRFVPCRKGWEWVSHTAIGHTTGSLYPRRRGAASNLSLCSRMEGEVVDLHQSKCDNEQSFDRIGLLIVGDRMLN